MKLIHGANAGGTARGRATPGEDLAGWVGCVRPGVAQAVAFAHACGLIHRDAQAVQCHAGRARRGAGPGLGHRQGRWRRDRSRHGTVGRSLCCLLFGRRGGKRPGRTGNSWRGKSWDAGGSWAPEQARGEASRASKGDRRLRAGRHPMRDPDGSAAVHPRRDQAAGGLRGPRRSRRPGGAARRRGVDRPGEGVPGRPPRGHRPSDAAEVADRARALPRRSRRATGRGGAAAVDPRSGRGFPRPPRRPRCGSGRDPGAATAEVAGAGRAAAVEAPAQPRRPPPGRCSRAFATFPCWPASTTRRALTDLPEPGGKSGRRSGRKSRRSLRGPDPAEMTGSRTRRCRDRRDRSVLVAALSDGSVVGYQPPSVRKGVGESPHHRRNRRPALT